MRIASSPVLIRGEERRQVVLDVDYNLKKACCIKTLSFRETEDGWEVDTSDGVFTNNMERARHTFVKQWEVLHEEGYVFDPEWNY